MLGAKDNIPILAAGIHGHLVVQGSGPSLSYHSLASYPGVEFRSWRAGCLIVRRTTCAHNWSLGGAEGVGCFFFLPQIRGN